jgi:hypothetical protein
MSIEVTGTGSLDDAVETTLKKYMDVSDVHVNNAAQAYAVVRQGNERIGCAFYLALKDNQLFLEGGRESMLSAFDSKRLVSMPSTLLNKLTDSAYANHSWRKNCQDYNIKHEQHVFRGAVLVSNNPPDIYREGPVGKIIITQPASHKAFSSNGSSLILPKEFRSDYKITQVPMIDANYCRSRKDDRNAVINSAKIMAKNLSHQNIDQPLTARLLIQGKTQPVLLIARQNGMVPIGMSKEAGTFDMLDAWGQQHNSGLGINEDFILNNSLSVENNIDTLKIEQIHEQVQIMPSPSPQP